MDEETQVLHSTRVGRNGDSGKSLMDELVERRSRRSRERVLDLDVPGWQGCLVLRCQPIRPDVLARLSSRAAKSDRELLAANSDLLIEATREVLIRRNDSEPLQPLGDADDPVRIDERLAVALKVPATRARDVLLALYDGANVPEVAINAHAGEYIEWAHSANDELDEEFTGES